MITLVLIGLVGGFITGISPCILPVLPVVFLAGGTSRRDAERPAEAPVEVSDGVGGVALARRARMRRNLRPYAVIAGLVISFTFFTLAGSLLISALGLPGNVLRVAGLVVLVVIGLGLIFPKVEALLEKPFARLPQRAPNQEGGAFVLGLGLGLLYVPCAGPVLTAITVASATGQVGLPTVALTLSFAIGATLPLLAFALAGRRVAERVRAFRARARRVRLVAGVVMILLAVALTLNLQEVVQRAIPDYTAGLQQQVAGSDAVQAVVPKLTNLADDRNRELDNCTAGSALLASCGPAPEFSSVTQWFNTSTPAGLTMAGLRGKVTLIDFWTYSCINCQRSIPHVEAWDAAYRAAGLQVIGVHTPEFAFERDPGNVADGIRRLGITYPVAMDNGYSMFGAYRNQYWPAQFLVDATGTVRYLQLGEGDYATTENHIRELLTAAAPTVTLPGPTGLADRTVTDPRTTRETYLNAGQIKNYVGDPVVLERDNAYRPAPALPKDAVTFGGQWNVGYQNSTAGLDATIGLHYAAKNVYVVLAGDGTATVDVTGGDGRSFSVSGAPRVYPLVEGEQFQDTTLSLRLTPGLQAFVFTFG